MKLAVIAITNNGVCLAAKIRRFIPCKIYVKRGRGTGGVSDYQEFDSLPAIMPDIFGQFDGIVFIAAAGIAVRMIAPHIVHKMRDPAVVVLDEQSKYAISLLSGHLGGANRLTQQVAAIVAAIPVITTATDVGGKMAVDQLAAELGLRIVDIAQVKNINGAIVAGKQINYYIDEAMPQGTMLADALLKYDIAAVPVCIARLASRPPAVVITDDKEFIDKQSAGVLVLRSGKLVAGIGCRRGTSMAEISTALALACQSVNKKISDIAAIASTAAKRDEAGLLAVAKQLAVPIEFYENDCLEKVIKQYHLEISEFVEKQIGVGNVCESAAIMYSQAKKLVLRKHKYPKVTVALAWEK